ncbi:MraY family glycosyltransferase [Glutamicibacter endophyticus]|uniref:MraY family glycosyltransferase n=1 Tax=Glutamicibacter endophyticus TaxID=1522174 RepID=UPI003AF07437
MRLYVLLIAFSFAVSYLLTPVVRSVGERFTAGQQLRDRDVHTAPIVKFGGLGIIAALGAGLWLASYLRFFSAVYESTDAIRGVGLALVAVCILGLADDLMDLKWWIKLGGQIAIAGIVVAHGIVIQALPVGSWQIEQFWVQASITILLIVMTMNAVNFSDGLDGLAAGLAAIGAATFFLYSYVLATHVNAEDYANFSALICALLLGACLGFLPHNFNPANIFMGESGVLGIGLVLSVATIAVTGDVQGIEAYRFRNVPAYMPIVLPAVIVFLPVLDLGLSVIRRLSKRRSPFAPDSKHIHHKMLAQGHSVRKSVLLLYLWAIFVALTVVLVAFIPLTLLIPLCLLLGLGVGLLTWWPLVRRRALQLRDKRTGRAG